MNAVEEKIKALGLELPTAPPVGGIYQPVLITGNHLYVSGQGPFQSDGQLIRGKVGSDLTVAEGKLAARQVGLTMISTIKVHLGDLDKIKRLVKTFGMVNCYPDFDKHPQVMDGFSQFMADILGEENGKGARSAIGMSLPGNIAVEVECIFELRNQD